MAVTSAEIILEWAAFAKRNHKSITVNHLCVLIVPGTISGTISAISGHAHHYTVLDFRIKRRRPGTHGRGMRLRHRRGCGEQATEEGLS